jgi:hypothetical protein
MMKRWFEIRNETEDIIMQIEQEMIIYDDEYVPEVSEDMEFVKKLNCFFIMNYFDKTVLLMERLNDECLVIDYLMKQIAILMNL